MHNELLFSGSEDATVRVWNIASLKCIRTLTGHTGVVQLVDYFETTGPNGRHICMLFETILVRTPFEKKVGGYQLF